MRKKYLPLSISIVFLLCVSFLSLVSQVHADTVTDNSLNFLKSKQDTTGRITTGFSAPSQWSAIAFAANGVGVATVKNGDKSLLDFLVADVPSNNAATDWENRILAIVAIGQNPTNFGGTNYVSSLESLYTNGQLGDTCSVNDDVFGLLALLAAGTSSSTTIKQSTLDFIISKQSSDGGFGFSAPGCAWYETSSDMTGAALQSLVEAKNKGLSSGGLDGAMQKAKEYLLAHKNADGGYGYFGSSDPDTTGWVLQAFNVSGMKDSSDAVAARNYLLAQQSATDGGFMAFDWGTNALVSNATTTAQTLIALSGKGWIINVYDPSVQTSTPVSAPISSPTVTPTPTQTSSNSTSTPTNMPTPTLTLNNITPTATPLSFSGGRFSGDGLTFDQPSSDSASQETAEPTNSEQQVLGMTDHMPKVTLSNNSQSILIASMFTGLGILLLFIYFAKPFILRKINQ